MSIQPSKSSFDVIVIGGGLLGSGVARDAALRGLSCVLLEQGDFASGASSHTSRLLRGGALSVGRASLAPDLGTVEERDLLTRMAPHLVHPLSIVRPVYKGDPRGLWRYRVGMTLSETLSLGKAPPHAGVISPIAALRRAPFLSSENLRGAGVFSDFQVPHPERLVLETIHSARDHGAHCLNYTRVVALEEAPEGLSVDARDASGSFYRFQGRCVVNASGAWADRVAGLLRPDAPKRVSLQRGTHVVLDWGFKQGFFATGPSEVGPFFALPLEGMALVGVAREPWSGAPGAFDADADRVKALLEALRRAAPGWDPENHGPRWAFAGIYAAPAGKRGGPAAPETPRHQLFREGPGGRLLTLAGGDLTSCRRCAEETVDAVCRLLGHPVPCSTDRVPLVSGGFRDPVILRESLCECTQGIPSVPRELVGHLVGLYGRRCCEVIDLALHREEWWQPLAPGRADIGAQVIYAARAEDAHCLEDVLLRRLRLGLSPDRGLSAAPTAARLLGEELGWDSGEVQAQLKSFAELVSRGAAAARPA